MKISNQTLYNINKNEYQAQQESTLEEALEMGLTEDEFNILDKYYTEAKPTVSPETQQELLTIYNRIFHQKMNLTSCSSCFKNNLHKKLERVYKEYNK